MNRIPLRLLHLPFVVLEEVLRCLNPIELYFLTRCSKRCANLVPRRNGLWLSVHVVDRMVCVNDNFKFRLLDFTISKKFDYFDWVNCEGNLVRFLYYDSDSETGKDNSFIALKKFVVYLSKLLKCKVKSFNASMKLPCEETQLMIKDIADRQEGIIENLFIPTVFCEPQLKWILENVKVTGNLKIATWIRADFEVDFEPFCKRIDMAQSKWISIERLLSFKSCSVISVILPNEFRMDDLNVLFQYWKNNHFTNLEYLKLENVYLTEDDRILGFSVDQLRTVNHGRRKAYYKNNYAFWRRIGGVNIKANDGTDATIQWKKLYGTLELFVWRD